MKTKIPDELKADLPLSLWGRILSATPVVMTVVATLLAGLASSEMTRAQYDRSLAAQLQSKAGDQWNYFQAKKLRGAIQRNSLDLLRATTDVRQTSLEALGRAAGIDPSTLDALEDVIFSATTNSAGLAPEVKAALEAVAADRPETEVTDLLKEVNDKSLAGALEAAEEQARAFNAKLQTASAPFDQMGKRLDAADKSSARNFIAAQLELNAERYDIEARLNQAIANIYELQVRKGNISAERHHNRSQRFFYGMLASQAAVIIATFAIAAKQRNLLWSLAAAAGVAAILFAIYVYVYV